MLFGGLHFSYDGGGGLNFYALVSGHNGLNLPFWSHFLITFWTINT
jgi:hypothetical protein